MGTDATASLSYGFIIPQPMVLKVLQKLQNSEKKVKKFEYGDGPERLTELLNKHLKEEWGIDEEQFEMVFLTSGEVTFEGMAILYNETVDRVTAWGYGSQTFEPLSYGPEDNEQVKDADAAFERLSDVSLFKELGICVDPEWLLGCQM